MEDLSVRQNQPPDIPIRVTLTIEPYITQSKTDYFDNPTLRTPIDSRHQVCLCKWTVMQLLSDLTFSSSTSCFNAIDELKALTKIINDSVASIESTMTSQGLEFPSLHTPMTLQTEEARMLPEVGRACSLIVSAATQLVRTVQSPTHVLVTATLQVRKSTTTLTYSNGEIRSMLCP